jgi:hypothetical protein
MEVKLDTSKAVEELREKGITEFNVEGGIDEAVVSVEKNGDIIKGSIHINLDANTEDMDDYIFAGEDNVVGEAAQGVVEILEEGWNKSPDLEASQAFFHEGREAGYQFRYEL